MEDPDENNNADSNVAKLEPKEVKYCGVCGYPPEYCEFGPDIQRCLLWMKERASTLCDTEEKVKAMVDMNESLGRKRPKGEDNGEPVVEEEGKKKRSPKVTVSRVQRQKRKFLTLVCGLEKYNVAPKDACTAFKKKFACGATQVKGSMDIEIQGDVTYEIAEFICQQWPQIAAKNVKFGEDAKKKK